MGKRPSQEPIWDSSGGRWGAERRGTRKAGPERCASRFRETGQDLGRRRSEGEPDAYDKGRSVERGQRGIRPGEVVSLEGLYRKGAATISGAGPGVRSGSRLRPRCAAGRIAVVHELLGRRLATTDPRGRPAVLALALPCGLRLAYDRLEDQGQECHQPDCSEAPHAIHYGSDRRGKQYPHLGRFRGNERARSLSSVAALDLGPPSRGLAGKH